MAITLLDMQRDKVDDFDKEVIEMFLMECDLSHKLPIESSGGKMEVTHKRTDSVQQVGWRSRGQMFGQATRPNYDYVSDAVFPMGRYIDIDKQDAKVPGNTLMQDTAREVVKAMAWEFNDKVINGDHGTEPDAPEGIKVRIAGLPSRQTLYGVDSSTKLDVAAAIAANTTATMQSFFDRIDEAVYACDGHTADVCLTDADVIKALRASERRLNIYKDTNPTEPVVTGSGQRRTTAQWYNKPVYKYNGVDFYDVGYKYDQSTHVIGTDTINSVACRPLYFLKLGHPYFYGIQQYGIEIGETRLLDDTITLRTAIDWPIGFHHVHKYGMSVLKGVKVA